jgi:hypothetical protein
MPSFDRLAASRRTTSLVFRKLMEVERVIAEAPKARDAVATAATARLT